MDVYYQVGAQIRSFLSAFLGGGVGQVALGPLSSDENATRMKRRDASLVPGSRHYATVLAYGNFILADGTNIRCEAIQGISGVIALPTVQTLADGAPHVQLRRYLTHFYLGNPNVVIEQNPDKESVGTLTGASTGDVRGLLPGRATFSQFLILSLNGKPLANREPLVMTADRVEEWPPIGSSFVSESPTHFYELHNLDDAAAKPFATLAACKAITVTELNVPDR